MFFFLLGPVNIIVLYIYFFFPRGFRLRGVRYYTFSILRENACQWINSFAYVGRARLSIICAGEYRVWSDFLSVVQDDSCTFYLTLPVRAQSYFIEQYTARESPARCKTKSSSHNETRLLFPADYARVCYTVFVRVERFSIKFNGKPF